MTNLRPNNVDELRQALRDHASVQIVGAGTSLRSGLEVEGTIQLDRLSGVVDLHPQDLTCAVCSGTAIVELQDALGLRLPDCEWDF